MTTSPNPPACLQICFTRHNSAPLSPLLPLTIHLPWHYFRFRASPWHHYSRSMCRRAAVQVGAQRQGCERRKWKGGVGGRQSGPQFPADLLLIWQGGAGGYVEVGGLINAWWRSLSTMLPGVFLWLLSCDIPQSLE